MTTIITTIAILVLIVSSIMGQEKFQYQIKGDIQFDSRFAFENDLLLNSFHLRRARLNIEGKYDKNFFFRLLSNFAGSKIDLQDAFIEYRQFSYAKLRAGKFKSPVGLERLQSPTNSFFIELALPTNMVPNRDIGIQVLGEIFSGTIQYNLALLNGVIDGENSDGDNNNNKEFVARLFSLPFKSNENSLLRRLGMGISVSYENQQGTILDQRLPSYKTSGRQTFFKYISNGKEDGTVIANGRHFRFSPQAYLYFNSIGMIFEYVTVGQELTKQFVNKSINNSSWQTSFSILLTEDEASYEGVKPKKEFDLFKNQWGAVELVLRYNELIIDPNCFPVFADPAKSAQKAKAWAIGINWYLNEYFKFSLNYENTEFKGDSTLQLQNEKIIMSRIQVVF